MRILAIVTLAALAGCYGYTPGPDRSYYDGDQVSADPIPNVTNDGFYEGGIFDQDMINPAPGRPRI